MSAQPVEPSRLTATYDTFRDLADGIVAEADRRGVRVRADISEQEIKVHMMSPSNPHGLIVLEVGFQIRTQDEGAVASVENRVHHPGLGLCRTADLLAATTEAYEKQDDDFAFFAPDVSVAIEVVSPSNPGNDYITKLRDYPRMGVPEYVIVDPRDGTVTVHSGPDTASGEPRYADTPRRYKFGDAVPMGSWTIETAKFPRYRV
ncbi:Uma2 family endonuclease [Streptomyces alboflavus]|uniref:Uma2 family endonuclease n=1 Tax=Streptomyces alboflavus TaxID=67267 RepID=UPI003694073E